MCEADLARRLADVVGADVVCGNSRPTAKWHGDSRLGRDIGMMGLKRIVRKLMNRLAFVATGGTRLCTEVL